MEYGIVYLLTNPVMPGLVKIRYEKGDDGFFHITDSYTTEKEKGRNLLIQIIAEGHFFPSIVDERLQRVLTEQHETKYKL